MFVFVSILRVLFNLHGTIFLWVFFVHFVCFPSCPWRNLILVGMPCVNLECKVHYFFTILNLLYTYIFLEVLVLMNQSNAFGTNKKLLMLSSDQMNRTSWGCEGVFLWCYGYVFMFVMWQEVVTCGGGGCCQMMAPGGAMCKLKVGGGWWRKKWRKKCRRGREEPLHNKQTSLPPPASHAHVLQLLVI